jgi:hypothetical protein
MQADRPTHRMLRMGDTYVVSVGHDGDGPLADDLWERFGVGPAQRVVVDLLRLQSLDPPLLTLLRDLGRRNDLTVVTDDPRTLAIFDATGATGSFAVKPTLAAALAR